MTITIKDIINCIVNVTTAINALSFVLIACALDSDLPTACYIIIAINLAWLLFYAWLDNRKD